MSKTTQSTRSRRAKTPPTRRNSDYASANKHQAERKAGDGNQSCDGATLYAETFAAPTFLVQDLLLAGHLTLIAGRPKSWKTWFALVLAIAVAFGRAFLGRHVAMPGRVLFCEFDDDRRQLNERLHLLLPKLPANGSQGLGNINFVQSLKPLRSGGLKDLEKLLSDARDAREPYRLLVIDPYFAVRSRRKGADWVADDYRELADLRQLCIRYGCAGVIVHHLRKAKSHYASDQVLGSTGLTAAVDAWLLVTPDPQHHEYRVVEIQGRSIPEVLLHRLQCERNKSGGLCR